MKVKNLSIYFLLLASMVLSISCRKKNAPIACLKGPENVTRYATAEYEWCGQDADNQDISWSTSWGQTAVGQWFNPEFPTIGRHTITVTAKNKYGSDTKSMEVEYGVYTTARVMVTNSCHTGNQNISSPTGYKAYVYSNIDEWATDVKSGIHANAIDSLDFLYSSEYKTIYAEFTTTTTPGSVLYLSVENRADGKTSNFGDLSRAAQDQHQVNVYGAIVFSETSDNKVFTALDENNKPLYRGKWMLKENFLNNNSVPLDACNLDDYLTFTPQGTWQYHVGADNCGGTSQESFGTFPFLQGCGLSPIELQTESGPFKVDYTNLQNKEIQAHYYAPGNVPGYFRFIYSEN